jgi:Trk-type K+ transport system membrane component
MTELGLKLMVGLVLMVVGAVLGPLFKRIWEWMNRPTPLTPQTQGQLVTSRAMAQASLDRLNYLSTHPKDLFLYLVQLVMAALLFIDMALLLYVSKQLAHNGTPADLSLVLILFVLVVAGVMCTIGLLEAGRLSDKKINPLKERIQKSIDEINNKLSPPA